MKGGRKITERTKKKILNTKKRDGEQSKHVNINGIKTAARPLWNSGTKEW